MGGSVALDLLPMPYAIGLRLAEEEEETGAQRPGLAAQRPRP